MADDAAARTRRIQIELERARAQARANAAKRGQKPGDQTVSGAVASTLSGIRSGSERLAGTLGDIPDYVGAGANYVADKLALSDPTFHTGGAGSGSESFRREDISHDVSEGTRAMIDPRAAIEGIARGLGYSSDTGDLPHGTPTTADVQAATNAAYPDEASRGWANTRYQPKTAVERGLHTAGELAPNLLLPGMGGMRGVVEGVIAPAAGAEAGGAIGEKLGYPNTGRAIGGLGAALLPGGATRMIAGPELQGERGRLVQLLGQEGVDLTAGQASGRKALQYAEAGPFNTKPAGIAEQQGEQFNRAALQRAGINADRATPDTIQDARDAFGAEYDNLIATTGGVPLDQQMAADLVTLVDDYHRLRSLPPNAPTQINAIFQRISDAAHNSGGVIPTDVFQQLRSEISRSIRRLKDDPTQSHALREFQDTLYDSIGRNAPPGTEAAWRDLNNRYRNFKIIEKSMTGAGEATAEGMITPPKLRTAVQNANPGDYVAGQGDFADLARAGEVAMKPLPQSGTTPRNYLLGTLLGGGAAGGYGIDPMTILKGLPLAGIPPLVSAALTAGPVRRMLLSRVTGEQPHFNVPAAMLSALQQRQDDQTRR